jgi:hypothetical protein
MKLINSGLLVFMNVSINPAFQIQDDDEQAFRSQFVVPCCSSSIKQMSLVMRISTVHGTVPIHFDKLVMDFSRANAFRVQILND